MVMTAGASQADSSVEDEQTFAQVPLEGLDRAGSVAFPLYLKTGSAGRLVLYREADNRLEPSHIDRLLAEGVDRLYVRAEDRHAYFAHVRGQLDTVLRSRSLPVEARAECLHGVALVVAEDLLGDDCSLGGIDPRQIEDASGVLAAGCSFLQREERGLRAVRRLLAASDRLAEHSLAVSMLSMGLARQVLGDDPAVIRRVGLAGLLHDVGCLDGVGDDDEAHVARGAERLRELGLDDEVCAVARDHHERFDGSGWPRGLAANGLSEMAQIVSLADTFDRIYALHYPRVGVYDTLRILAQAYRGCFEVDLASEFVSLFN